MSSGLDRSECDIEAAHTLLTLSFMEATTIQWAYSEFPEIKVEYLAHPDRVRKNKQ